MKSGWHTLALWTAITMLGCGQSHTAGSDSGATPAEDDAGSCCFTDAPGPPPEGHCDGLAPAACLGAGCVPAFDDSCCPMCSPEGVGGCADCTRPAYLGCFLEESSSCRGGPGCGLAPAWACGPVAADCSTAHVVALDTCDRVGCVPAYPSGEGDPAIESAVCTPIIAVSCSAFCRRLPPICPTGTVPEGDGSCYTNRCIPAFVCG